MIVLPSIDIEGGRAVKREHGERGKGLLDLGDPVALAARWRQEGARGLHLVDLDGAEGGEEGTNRELVLRVIREAGVPVQVGGGLREAKDLEEVLTTGAWRALLSTRAWKDRDWLLGVTERFGPRVGLSFDVEGGRLRLGGWKEEGPRVDEGLRIASEAKAGFLLYTDVAREGTQAGIDLVTIRELRARFAGDLYVAGGVSSHQDLRALHEEKVDGVVVGRALYEGRVPSSVLSRGLP